MQKATKTLKYWDLFCGASLAGTGIEIGIKQLGFTPHGVGINHNQQAIATSKENHPENVFLCTDIHTVDPLKHFPERDAFLGWASPACTHHSTARGGRPINDQERITAFEVVNWISQTRPKLVLMENVPEFEDWGPLRPQKDKATGKYKFSYVVKANGKEKRKETTEVPIQQGDMSFETWIAELEKVGYELCWHKDPARAGETFQLWVKQIRELGYEVDWRNIVCADLGDPTTRKRLFVSCAHIASGYRVVWPEYTHAKPDYKGEVPLGRQPWIPARKILDLEDLGKPISERTRQLAPKTLNRIVIGLKKFVLQPFILPQQRGGAQVKSVNQPVSPITTKGAEALAIVKFHGSGTVESLQEPLSTVSPSGVHHGLLSTNLVKFFGTGTAVSASEPLDTVTSKGRFALMNSFVTAIDQQSTPDATTSADSPLTTVVTKQRHGVVNVSLAKVGSKENNDGPFIPFDLPGGVTGRLILNCLTPGGKGRPILEAGNQRFEIEVYFRMLKVEELAAAQGLPKGYKFAGTKTDAVRQIGNGVPINTARALTMCAISQNSRAHIEYALAA